jgi:hypothetical protein
MVLKRPLEPAVAGVARSRCPVGRTHAAGAIVRAGTQGVFPLCH